MAAVPEWFVTGSEKIRQQHAPRQKASSVWPVKAGADDAAPPPPAAAANNNKGDKDDNQPVANKDKPAKVDKADKDKTNRADNEGGDDKERAKKRRKLSLVVFGAMCAVLVVVMLVDAVSLNRLYTTYGLRPRLPGDWKRVFTMVWVHKSVGHAAQCLFLFCALGFAIVRASPFGVVRLLTVFAVGWIVGGFVIFGIGRAGYHAGLNAVVFAMLSYVFGVAYFEKSRQAAMYAAGVFVCFVVLAAVVGRFSVGGNFEDGAIGFVLGVVVSAHGKLSRRRKPLAALDNTPSPDP